MKKFREFLSKPVVTAVLFALAVFLLAGGTIGGTRAALNIQSEFYNSEVELLDIGVALVEKNNEGKFVEVAGKNSLMGENSKLGAEIKADKKFKPGKTYPEELAVRNTGKINEYVRVAVYKYWLDENNNKFSELNSEWIELKFTDNKGWTIDSTEGSSTEERTILYYADMIAPGKDTEPFLESVTINDIILSKVTQETYKQGDVTVIETTFMYNGCKFCIEVHVDSVQDHNVDEAKISAWGVNK